MNNNNSELPIIDGHVDLLYEMSRFHPDISFNEISEGPVTLEKLKTGNIRVIVTAFYCPDEYNGPGRSVKYLENLFKISDKYLTGLYKIKTGKELELCMKEEAGTIFLLENSDALLEMGIERLHEKGLKVAGLTHAGKNRIGDGNGVKYPDGLTKEGKKLVKFLDINGFAVDLAHLSDPCFREVIDLFKGPMISSHTGVRYFCNNPRNLSAEQIEIILQRNGIIGITINPEMLSEDNTAGIQDVFKHIDFIAQKYGADGIALGSDLCGFDSVNNGLEDISKLKNLAELFYKRGGYPLDAIEKIMGKNWYDFYFSLFETDS